MSRDTLIQTNSSFSRETLSRLRALPLEQKAALTERRILQFSEARGGAVFVSFSGGKDSTVLLDIARRVLPGIPAVFIDTGLEFPEIRDFVKATDNVEWLRPAKTFKQVLDFYGLPLPSKEIAEALYEWRNTRSEKLRALREKKLSGKWAFLKGAPFKISDKCCDIMKKAPSKAYEKRTGRAPLIATMTEESRLRLSAYTRQGCTVFDGPRPHSTPMAFWTEADIWEYIKTRELPYASIYDKGYERTGCAFCLFGVFSRTGSDKFARMKETHPALYSYCINSLGYKDVFDFCNSHLKNKVRY